MKARLFLVVLACIGMLAFGADSMAAKKVKVWTGNPEGDPVLEAMRDAFKPFVEKASNGKYEVEIYPSASLGNSDSAFQGAQFGSIEFVVDSVNNVGQFVPEFAALDVPYLLPDQEKMDRAFSSPAIEKLWSYGEKKGIKPLDVALATNRGIMSTKPILTLEDAKGKKDRTSSSKYHIATMEALGFIPTPMSPSETLTALQQGVVDAVDYELHAYLAQRIVDVAKNLVLSEHLPVLYMAYAGGDWWNGLSDEDKEMFTQAMKAYHEYLTNIYKERNAKVLETMANEHGVTITRLSPEEKARWMEAVRGVSGAFPPEIMAIAEEIRSAGEGK